MAVVVRVCRVLLIAALVVWVAAAPLGGPRPSAGPTGGRASAWSRSSSGRNGGSTWGGHGSLRAGTSPEARVAVGDHLGPDLGRGHAWWPTRGDFLVSGDGPTAALGPD